MADGFGTASAALSVLSEVIGLINHVRETAATQNELPEVLNKYYDEVKLTQEWVTIVETDSLEIPSVAPTIATIQKLAEGLRDHLNVMGVNRSATKQFLHLFVSGTKERKVLETILQNMEYAKIDLIVRVQFVLIGINRNIETAINLSIERIKAVDEKLSERVSIGNYPNIMELLEKHTSNADGTVTVTKKDLEELLRKVGIDVQPTQGPGGRATKNISRNILGEASFVVVGAQGGKDKWADSNVSITDNIMGGYGIFGPQETMDPLKILAETRMAEARAKYGGGGGEGSQQPSWVKK